MPGYRDELEALRAQKEALEEKLRDTESELGRKKAELARRDRTGAEEAPTPAKELARGEPLPDEVALAPPATTMLQPNVGCAVTSAFAFAVVFGVAALGLLAGSLGSKQVGFGWMSLVFGLPVCVWLLHQLLVYKRFMRFSRKGLEFRCFGNRLERFPWGDIEQTRIVVTGRSGQSAVSVKSKKTGRWHDAEAGYLGSGREVADLIDRWRAYAREEKLLFEGVVREPSDDP